MFYIANYDLNQYNISETEATVEANGYNYIEAWGVLRRPEPFEGAIGMLTTFNISDQSTGGGSDVGIREFFGTMSNGNKLRVDIETDWTGDTNDVVYRVREKDSNGNTVNEYGGFFGQGAITGKKLTLLMVQYCPPRLLRIS